MNARTLSHSVSLLVLVIVMAGPVVCSSRAAGQMSLTGTIAFDSFRVGPEQIYTMPATGKHVKRISKNTNYEYFATWSPDGQTIAFVSGAFPPCTLWLMDRRGANRTALVTMPGSVFYPSWSPDGERIAFGSDDGLYLIDLTSQTPVLLHSRGGVTIPSWSPDGLQIAFSYQTYFSAPDDIYRIDIDGSNLVNLTNTPSIGESCPTWQGNTIAYIQGPYDWYGDVYVMDPDGFNRNQISFTGGQAFGRPAWSPNGDGLAFSARASTGYYGIFAVELVGGATIQISRVPSDDFSPSWTP